MVWKVANIVELGLWHLDREEEGKFERYLGDRSTGLDDQLAFGSGEGKMEGDFQNFGLGDWMGTWDSFIHSAFIEPPGFPGGASVIKNLPVNAGDIRNPQV